MEEKKAKKEIKKKEDEDGRNGMKSWLNRGKIERRQEIRGETLVVESNKSIQRDLRGVRVKEIAAKFENKVVEIGNEKTTKINSVREKWDKIVKNSKEESKRRKEKLKEERKHMDRKNGKKKNIVEKETRDPVNLQTRKKIHVKGGGKK